MIGRKTLVLIVTSGLIGLLSTGCGDDDERTAVRVPTERTTTVTVGEDAPATTTGTGTQTSATTTTPAPGATTPAETVTVGEPPSTGGVGAGDEEAIRVPVAFTISGGGITPEEVRVPAFLALEISVASKDGRAHTVTVAGTSIAVPANGSAAKQLTGLEDGRYPVGLDGGASTAALVVGGDAGP